MSTREALRPIRGNVYGSQGQGEVLDVPRCSVYYAAGGNVATATDTIVPFDTVDYDTDGSWDATLFRMVAGTQGLYLFNAWVLWASNATSYRQARFSKNGGGVLYGDTISSPGTGTFVGTPISALIPMNASDYVTLIVNQNTGGPLALIGASATDRFNGFQSCLISTTQ